MSVAALDGDAEFFHAGERRQLGDGDPQPRRTEVSDDHLRDRFRGVLEQGKMLARKKLSDRCNDFRIIDGVLDAVAVGGMLAAQADFEIQLYGLRDLLLAVVDADEGVDAQFADEYGVHVGERAPLLALEWSMPF